MSNYKQFTIFIFIILFYYFKLSKNDEYSDPNYPLVRISKDEPKYLSVKVVNGRLGNQMFSIISGYAIAQDLGRIFYVSYDPVKKPHMDAHMAKMDYIFPNLKNAYERKTPEEELGVVEKRAKETHQYAHSMIHASQFLGLPDKFIRLVPFHGQSYEYFSRYEKKVKEFLQFSSSVKNEGEEIIRKNNLTRHSYICAHTRRTDFLNVGSQTDLNITIAILEKLSKLEPTNLFLMGDDPTFMQNVINEMGQKASVGSFYSEYSEGIDFYLSNQLCSSFVITAPISTFGFWLGYFTENCEVYYLDNRTRIMEKTIDNIFPASWKPLSVINQTIMSG